MNSSTKQEQKIYSIAGSIYGSLVACYMIIQFALNGIQGITANIPILKALGILFGALMSICSIILAIRRLIS